MKIRLSKFISLCLALSLTACASGQGRSEKLPDTSENGDSDAFVMSPENTKCDIGIVVSPLNVSSMNGGKFQGWGTSLCWWANRLGYSDELAQQSADLFFGEDGLRFNIMRYNIGGGDNPSHKHIKRTDSAVPGWLVYDKETGSYTYDYSADYRQLNVLKRAAEAAGEDAYVEVFSNSPPYFMTESGCSSGNFDPNKDNLKPEYYTEFAEYLAEAARYINDELGVKVSSVSPMNEPNTNFWGANSPKQEGCHVDAGKSQSEIISETAKAFAAKGLGGVEIVGSDETNPELQVLAYNSYSADARAAISRISTHTYGINGISELGALAKSEGFNLWMSEVDGKGTAGENAGEMASALWIGEKIISDINALSPSAWVMWQVIDNHISSEGMNGNTDSGMVDINGGFWGAAVADHDNETIILTQKYYGIGQFTRYIRPGDTIIHCGGDSLAAYNSDSGKLTIVAMNKSAEDKMCNFNLSQMKSIGRTVKAIRTSGDTESGEKWAELDDISAYESGFIAELKGNSITTFIIDGVTLGEVKLSEISIAGATATGSTPWRNGSDTADKVIDGDTATFFDGVADGWLEIDLGSKTEFSVLGFAPRAAFEGRMLDGKFYGSNNGKSWEVIYEVKSSPAAGMNYIFLPKKAKYRYIRYDVPQGDGYNCNIAEVGLFKADK